MQCKDQDIEYDIGMIITKFLMFFPALVKAVSIPKSIFSFYFQEINWRVLLQNGLSTI